MLRPSRFPVFSALFLLILFVASPVHAQRPRVGLALGGGAARGAAHVGILLWLEENHIAIDYVAGTSMGALIGGAYAAGLSPQEIRDIMEAVDWNTTLATQPPYRALDFRRKQDLREYPAAFELGLRHGIQLPGGLNSAPGVNLLLSRIAASAGPVTNFDTMPIPFRCVATDLYSGKSVALSNGPLVTALLATMAIPGLFTPVERDGMLLADGGVLDNVPADVARQMGADIVIAVDVLEAFDTSKKPFKTLLDVLGRQQDVAIQDANSRRKVEADVFLRPDLEKLGALDWTITREAIKRGYAVAEANAAALRKYAVPEAEWQTYIAARTARKAPQPFVPQFVTVTGTSRRQAQAIQERLGGEVGKPLNSKRLENNLNLLSGSNRFTTMTYTPIVRDNTPGLGVTVAEKPYGPPFLNLGPDIRSDRTRDVTAVLGGRVTLFDVLAPDAEVRLDFGLGTVNTVAGEYFYPLRQKSEYTPFVAAFASANSTPLPFFENGKRVADYRLRSSSLGADLGLLIGRTGEVRLGVDTGWQSANLIVGSQDSPTESGPLRRMRLRYTYDGQDRPIVPTHGVRVIAEGQRITRAPGAEGTANRLEVRGSWFQPSSDRSTLFAGGAFGSLSGGTPSALSEFSLGGVLRLGAYQPGEIQGKKYYYGTAGYLHVLNPGNFLLGGRTSVGVWGEVGDAWGSRLGSGADGTGLSLSTGLLVETPLGPLMLGGSVGQAGRSQLFFSLGRFLN